MAAPIKPTPVKPSVPKRAYAHLQLQPLSDRPSPLRITKSNSERSHNSLWRSAVSAFLFVGAIFFTAALTNAFVFQSYYVEGTSMTPTLHNNDRLIIDKVGHTYARLQGKYYVPSRGDIVIIDSTLRDEKGNLEQLIKRVIALPGERVVVEGGTITVYNKNNPNGFNADKALGLHSPPTFCGILALMFRSPTMKCLSLGDNRVPGGSLDSRVFGPVTLNNLEGRLWIRVFPFSSASLF